MNELLNNPAVQAGVAPFLTALIVAALLRRSRLLGLAIGAGFFTVVWLAVGFSFESLTSVRKMILVGAVATLLVLVLELANVQARAVVRAALAAAVAVAALWVSWRLLQQLEARVAWLAGAAAAGYVAILVESGNRLGSDPVRAACSALALGLGSGGLALLGASASLAQVGIAIGAGSGAVLLIQMLTSKRVPVGWTLALPANVLAGLVGLLAVFTGVLPWYCLLPTLATPWATRLVPSTRWPLWLTAVLCAVAALVPMMLAVSLAWFAARSSPA